MQTRQLITCLILALPFLPETGAAQVPVDSGQGNFGRLTMVGPDGERTDCGLRSLTVRVRLEGGMARTEVEQVFENPLPVVGQGTFDFQLPPGAAIDRLALEMDGRLVEGEIVERQRARMVYEQIVRQMRDPALVEWQGGDRFKTQVYPIPARGTKRVVLAYLSGLVEEDGGMVYRYQLPAAGSRVRIGRFDFLAESGDGAKLTAAPYDARMEGARVRFTSQAFAPRGDLLVHSAAGADRPAVSLRQAEAGERRVFSATIRPDWPRTRHTPPRDITLLVDSSASQAGRPMELTREAVATILASLGPADRVRLISGDKALSKAGPGFVPPARADGLLQTLKDLEPGGGTDLAALLLAGATRAQKGRRALAIYIGDGQASLGELDGDLLAGQLRRAYGGQGVELHAIGLGRDPAVDYLRRLASENAGRLLVHEAGQGLDVATFMRSLKEPLLVRSTLSAPADCLSQIMPDRLPALIRGRSIEIMGLRGPRARCRLTLSGSLAGKPHRQTFDLDFSLAKDSTFLPAFWARARIAHLERAAGDRREIVALSKEFGIMSRYTSWLVLENDEAYKRHQIERRQKANRQKAAEQQAVRQDKSRGPLSKQKLGEGQSMGDFIDQFEDSDADGDREEERREEAPAERATADRPAPPPRTVRAMRLPKMEKKKSGKMDFKPQTKAQMLASAEAGYKASPDDPQTRRRLVSQLAASGKLAEAHGRIEAWFHAAEADPDRLIRLVAPAIDALPDDAWSRRWRVDLYRRAWEARPRSAEILAAYVTALQGADRAAEALALLERERGLAKRDSEGLLALIPAYGRIAKLPEAREALLAISRTLLASRPEDAHIRRVHLDQLKAAGLRQEALRAIVDWRRWAPDFPDLVLEHAALLREAGQAAQAARVLSELVEFNPHDYDARAMYARALAEVEGRPAEACAQYTRAVQLNPSKRDTFRTMMKLKREHPKAARAIEACIIDGVSRLPVIRDVSIIMLWDDDAADIDMHVIEAGGERVWYQHKESAQGGQLYYDVTDGYGPEVYVLGAGKPGTYRLQVVYYSGSRKTVRGRFIVLRNAGGPEEIRRVYPFQLKGPNQNKRVPITVFKLSR